MKKVLALMLALVLTFSLVTMPASAADTVSGDILANMDIDSLDSAVNYFYDYDASKAAGMSLGLCSANSTGLEFGVVDKTAETKTVDTPYIIIEKSKSDKDQPNIQDAYAKGENYDFVMASTGNLPDIYTENITEKLYLIEGRPFEGAFLKKVADPDNSTNNVLEYNFGNSGNNDPSSKRRGFIPRLTYGASTAMMKKDTSTAREVTNDDGSVSTYYTYKKQGTGIMAFSYDFKIPENSAKWLTSGSYVTLGEVYGSNMNSSGHGMLYDKTLYSNGKLEQIIYDSTGKKEATRFEITPDVWHTMKQVIIVDDAVESADGLASYYPKFMIFLDDKLVYEGSGYGVLAKSGSTYNYSGALRFCLSPTGMNSKGVQNTLPDRDVDFNIYYDDIKQYWVDDDLTISGINDSYEGFDPKADSIDVVYSNGADFDALEKAISVKLNGEVAENVSVNVERKDVNTATLTFSGLNTAKATTYDVEIAGFKDVYGNTVNGVKAFTITTYEAGKLNISKSDSVIDYEVGTHRALTLTSELKADISDVKFLIKNAEGEEVAELIPSANEEGTVFVFDLFGANLNTTGTYTFVTEGVFKEADGERVNTDIIEIPINVINYNFEGEYRINDNFDGEGIVKDVNWLTGGTKPSGWKYKCMHNDRNSGTYKANDQGVYMITECPRCVTIGATLPDNMLTDAFVGIVADPKDETNNVIKYVAGKNGDGNHSIRVYKGNKQEIDVTKNVVMSSKILLTESLKNYMDDYTYNDLPVMSTRGNYEDKFLYAQLETNSNGDLVLTGYNNFKTTLKTDEWFELKYVTMPTTNKVETRDENGNLTAVAYDVWTYMVYINDCLVDVDSKTVFKGVNGTRTENGVTYTGAFATTENTGLYLCGVHFGLYPINNPEVQPTFYVDDVKLYQPDNFVPTVKANGALVTISGNHTFAKNVLDTIKITDTLGNEVDVIGSKEISADKKTITLKLLEDEVAISTDYIITGVYDSIGQLAKDELTFKTPKSFGIFIDSVTKANTGTAGKVSTYVEIVNTKGEELPVALIVAVYGEECETLGVKCINIDKLTAEGYKTDVTVDIGENSKEDIKDIKVFLWDSIKTMIPYQLSESIEF